MHQSAGHRMTLSGPIALVGALLLSCFFLVAPAAAQIGPALADGATDKVGKTITRAGSKAGSTITKTGSKVGSTVGGSAGSTVSNTTSGVGQTVSGAGSSAGNTATQVGNTATGALNETSGSLQQTLNKVTEGTAGLAGKDKDGGKKSGSEKKRKKSGSGTVAQEEVHGNLVLAPDRLVAAITADPKAVYRTPLLSAPAAAIAPVEEGSFIGRAAQEAFEVAKRFAFPLALTVMVLAYLGVHGWFDRRDPKLAMAAIDPETETLRFE